MVPEMWLSAGVAVGSEQSVDVYEEKDEFARRVLR